MLIFVRVNYCFTIMMQLRIKEICKSKGVTLQEVADRMGVNRVSLSASINGNPTLTTLEKVANALGVEVFDLFAPSRPDFSAFIDHGGKLYRVNSIRELENLIAKLKAPAPSAPVSPDVL